MRKFGSSHRWWPVAVAPATLLLTPAALAQNTLSSVGEESTVFEAGPGNLPGRERGERERPVQPPADAPAQPAPAQPAPAETPAEPREWFGGKPWLDWSRLTGDWGGVRTRLADAGLAINGSYTLDWSSVWSGGLDNKASSRQLLDINAALDLEKAVGLAGGTVFADFYLSDVRGGSEHVGDYGGISNIATGVNVQQLAELWYQQWLVDKRVRVKAGKIDANAEFAFFNATGDFLNGPSANPVTMYTTFPTYPNPATGFVAFVYPDDQLYLGGGFFDGSVAEGRPTGRLGPSTFFDGDAKFWILEFGGTWPTLGSLGGGRALVGAWLSTADFTTFAGEPDSDTSGFYVMAEQQLIRRAPEGDLAAKGLFAFAEYGSGDGDVNPAENHIGAGLALKGTFAGRDDDSAGVMVNWIDLSDRAGAPYSDDEVAFELLYKVQLTPWASITPNLQYILNPGGNSSVDDAVVGQVRLLITF